MEKKLLCYLMLKFASCKKVTSKNLTWVNFYPCPGVPWEKENKDSVTLNAESVRSVVQFVRQNQATITELHSLLREGVRQGGGWNVVEAMMSKGTQFCARF